MTQTRFALDEARAAEWLAAQVAQTERFYSGESRGAPELEIGPGYSPQDDQEGGTTTDVVIATRDAGLITGPGTVDFSYHSDEDGEGYTWLVYLDGPGSLKLSTHYTKIKFLGAGDAHGGVQEALGVLREAVFEANALLDDLDRYYASKQG